MKDQSYCVPATRSRTEFTERKSRFITTLCRVESAEEAEAFLAAIRAECPDATHHCAAYRIKNPLIERFYDDGEPGGTAGMPMLDVLKKQDLYDAAVVVTRYFGGILLGAGGLCRAYSRGAAEGVEAAGLARMEPGVRMRIRCAYSLYERILRLPELQRAEDISADFGAEVQMLLTIRAAEEPQLLKSLADLSAGSAAPERLEQLFYPFKNT